MFVYDIYRWEILSKYSCTVIVEELPLGGALLTTKTFLSEVDIVEHWTNWRIRAEEETFLQNYLGANNYK